MSIQRESSASTKKTPGDQVHLERPTNSAWKQSWQIHPVDEPTSDSCVDVNDRNRLVWTSPHTSRGLFTLLESPHTSRSLCRCCCCCSLSSVSLIPGSSQSPAPRLRFSRRRTEPRNTHTFSFLPGRWRSNHTSPDGD